MQGISDIRIIGIDELRPPVITKHPYIDIFFQLSHQAPSDWCRDFNSLLAKHPSTPKIKEKEGVYIEAWVRKPDEIVTLLGNLKETISECTRQYIERIEISAQNSRNDIASLADEGGEQGRLNKILASLNYETDD